MPPRRTNRTDGRYNVTVTVENPDGTRRRLYFYARTQAEARRKADDAQDRIAQGSPVRDATRSVSDWLAEWRGTFLLASDRASSTKSLYSGLTLRHVEPVIGHVPLGQVRASDVTRVLLTMAAAGSAASTQRNAYAALRSAFDDAVADGLLALNPVLRLAGWARPSWAGLIRGVAAGHAYVLTLRELRLVVQQEWSMLARLVTLDRQSR